MSWPQWGRSRRSGVAIENAIPMITGRLPQWGRSRRSGITPRSWPAAAWPLSCLNGAAPERAVSLPVTPGRRDRLGGASMGPLPKERYHLTQFSPATVELIASMGPLPKERYHVGGEGLYLHVANRPQWGRSRRSGITPGAN